MNLPGVTQFTFPNSLSGLHARKSLKHNALARRRLALRAQAGIMQRMDKVEGDKSPDDGIVAEDVTLLVEHIELTSPLRLPESHDWERTSPAADLDDAPILIDEVADDDPELESMRVEDDTQLFTETQADLGQLLVIERRRNEQATALAAERARWQQRVEELQRALRSEEHTSE